MKKSSVRRTKVSTNIVSKQSLAEFIQAMQSVKTETEEANLNEATMSDNNGKRITYTIIKGKKYPKQ